MNVSLASLEIAVVLLGLGLLLVDLWAADELKPKLGYAAAAGLGVILLFSFTRLVDPGSSALAFGGMFIQDPLALFFKRLSLAGGILVLILSVDDAHRISRGIGEYYVLILFALAGMMFAASANDLTLLFVALELLTVTLYILCGYQRDRVPSLEAGVKYLIQGALASAFLVFGIALVYGTSGHLNFLDLADATPRTVQTHLFQVALFFVFAGVAFKIAAFPFHLWPPDVYQGAPTPTAALLATGSKAAGFVLLLRLVFAAFPDAAILGDRVLMLVAAVTMLYGNLCAIPQRNLKRLLGYSSIANAGYLLVGVSALNPAGQSAVLFYLATYFFAVLAAFAAISVVTRNADTEDLSVLQGLHRRAPGLAAVLALSMISLAGIPPLAGFFGKFLLLRALVDRWGTLPGATTLAGVMILAVVISLYYYLGVVRAVYWPKEPADPSPIAVSRPMRILLGLCATALLGLGIFPGWLLRFTDDAVRFLTAF